MGILDFLAAIIPSLGWPLVALVAFLFIRKPLYRFLEFLPDIRIRWKKLEIFLEDRHEPLRLPLPSGKPDESEEDQ